VEPGQSPGELVLTRMRLWRFAYNFTDEHI
jgi:hypothetical protein